MSGILLTLIVIEALLTVAGAGLYVYRGTIEFKEENTLILDDAEAHLMAGQAALHQKANQIGVWLKYIGILWLVFGVAALGIWLAEGVGVL